MSPLVVTVEVQVSELRQAPVVERDAASSSVTLVPLEGACAVTLTAAEAGALLVAAERARRRAPDPEALERAAAKLRAAFRRST